MFLDDAIKMAASHGYSLKQSQTRQCFDLWMGGEYIDTLHVEQIAEMEPEDFVEFYLA